MTTVTPPVVDTAALRTTWESSLGADPAWQQLSPQASIGTWTPGAAPATAAAAVGDLPAPTGYRLGELLDRGGMGLVWRARQDGLDRDIALKRPAPGADAWTVQRFLAEARIAGALEHPNIAPVHAVGQDQDGAPFLAMRLVGGRTWRTAMRAGDLDLDAHLAIAVQVANALAYAHSRGIVHCDLKPSNVMLGSFGEVQVLDWGLAVAFTDAASPAPHRSSVRTPVGTPAYMPPELALGRGEAIAPTTDVFLLGAALHEAVTGAPPHAGDQLWDAVAHAAACPPPVYADAVPVGVQALLRQAMARDPQQRQRDCAVLAEALKDVLRHRQSEVLSGHAVAALAAAPSGTAGGGYAGCNEAIAGFRQALALWPGNAAAAAGERRARLLLAQRALAAGDIALAEQQMAALPAGDPEAAPIVQAAAARRRDLRRAAAQARWLRRSAAFSALAIVVVLASALAVVRRERDAAAAAQAQEARSRANAERELASAEELTGFLISDLHRRLEPLGRIELLGDAAERAQAHYAARDPAGMDAAQRRKHVLALHNLAAVQAAKGDAAAAEASLRSALALAAQLRDAHPGDGGDAALPARVEQSLAELLQPRGDPAVCRDLLARGLATAAARAGDPDAAFDRARLHLVAGDLAREYQRWDEVAPAIGGAEQALAGIAKGHPREREAELLRADAAVLAAETALDRGQPIAPAIDRAIDIANRLYDLDHQNIAWGIRLGHALLIQDEDAMNRAKTVGQITNLIITCQSVIDSLASRPDVPRALLLHQTRALRLANRYGLLIDRRFADDDIASGTSTIEQAQKLIDTLIRHDPTNRRYRWEAALVGWERARRLAARGKEAEAASARGGCQRLCRELAAAPGGYPRASALLAEIAAASTVPLAP